MTGQKDSKITLEQVRGKMAKAGAISGRDSDDGNMIAISKMDAEEEITPIMNARHSLFGENRVQEAAEKWPELCDEFDDIAVHLVGQLQSNKAEDAVRLFDTIHSLDRVSLVKALAKAMDELDRRIPCFIQVNIGEEPQKGGCAIGELADLLAAAKNADVEVLGLMCVPPAGVNPAPYFALLAKLAQDNGLAGLSMGMSGDFETAIKLGATHVRVGTALFGARS